MLLTIVIVLLVISGYNKNKKIENLNSKLDTFKNENRENFASGLPTTSGGWAFSKPGAFGKRRSYNKRKSAPRSTYLPASFASGQGPKSPLRDLT